MEKDQIRRAFKDIFDQALVHHGFTPYMRDYDVFVSGAVSDPVTGTLRRTYLRYRFTHCVQAVITSTVSPSTWKRSLDPRLIDFDQGKDLDGFVWGTEWQELYPGMEPLPPSEEAKVWTAGTGLDFHEALIEGNAQAIRLIFHDLTVDPVPIGFTPFRVGTGESGTD